MIIVRVAPRATLTLKWDSLKITAVHLNAWHCPFLYPYVPLESSENTQLQCRDLSLPQIKLRGIMLQLLLLLTHFYAPTEGEPHELG